jgi:hypothetical protein
MRRVGIGLFVLTALGGGVFARQALADLPGYFEWVLWEETESVGAGASPTELPRAFRWVVGPYSRRTDCETDRNRLASLPRSPWPIRSVSWGGAGGTQVAERRPRAGL